MNKLSIEYNRVNFEAHQICGVLFRFTLNLNREKKKYRHYKFKDINRNRFKLFLECLILFTSHKQMCIFKFAFVHSRQFMKLNRSVFLFFFSHLLIDSCIEKKKKLNSPPIKSVWCRYFQIGQFTINISATRNDCHTLPYSSSGIWYMQAKTHTQMKIKR